VDDPGQFLRVPRRLACQLPDARVEGGRVRDQQDISTWRTRMKTKIFLHTELIKESQQLPNVTIDYRCDNRRFWLSAHHCQVPTATSQNLELEQQIRVFGAD
jgi:hypothetical protein